MRLVVVSILVFLVGCGDTVEDREAAVRAAAKQPVPVFQSNADDLDVRGAPLEGQEMAYEYWDVTDSEQIVGSSPNVPFVAAGYYGKLYRVQGQAGSMAFFEISDGTRFAADTNQKETLTEIGRAIAKRVGCRPTGLLTGRNGLGKPSLAISVDC